MVAGSYGKSMLSFVRNWQTVFQNGYTILHFHQQSVAVWLAPHLHQHLVASVFQLWVILVGVQCYLILTCISQWHLMRNIFSHVYLPSVLLFWWGFWPFFKLDHLLSYCWVLRVLWVFWITIFYQTGFLQIFPPSLWLVYSLSWQSHS